MLTEPGDPYGALTAIDPRTGYVRAMVGGRDYWNPDDDFARINLATGGVTGRQAGPPSSRSRSWRRSSTASRGRSR